MTQIIDTQDLVKKLNIYQKLAKIRAISDVAKKNKRGYNYTYTDVTEILANVTTGMKKYGVSLIPMIVPQTGSVIQNVITNTKFDKTGNSYQQTTTEMLFSADMVFKWVDDENPEDFIEIPWFITGSMADCAQAMGAGLTYTLRQFLTSFFQIAQADTDIDAYRSKQKAAEASEEKAITEGIISEFDKKVKDYLVEHPDKSEEVKAFVGKYVKSANYFSIKDSRTASKLLNDFTNTYLGGNE